MPCLLCRHKPERLWGHHGRPGLLRRHGQLNPDICSTACCAWWSCSYSCVQLLLLLLYILLLHQTLLSMTSSDTGPSSSFSREPCRVTARRLPLMPDANTPEHQNTPRTSAAHYGYDNRTEHSQPDFGTSTADRAGQTEAPKCIQH